MLIINSLDPNPRLYQASRGIKYLEVETVNTQKWLTTSSPPSHGSFVHLPTIKPSKKALKGLKCLQKAQKPLFPPKITKIPPKIAKIPKREEKE